MTHVFKPGEVVLVVGGPRRGEIATVERGPYVHKRTDGEFIRLGDPVYALNLQSIMEPWWSLVAVLPHWLVPVSDPDDRAELLNELRVKSNA